MICWPSFWEVRQRKLDGGISRTTAGVIGSAVSAAGTNPDGTGGVGVGCGLWAFIFLGLALIDLGLGLYPIFLFLYYSCFGLLIMPGCNLALI